MFTVARPAFLKTVCVPTLHVYTEFYEQSLEIHISTVDGDVFLFLPLSDPKFYDKIMSFIRNTGAQQSRSLENRTRGHGL